MAFKYWKIPTVDEKTLKILSNDCKTGDFVAEILANRNINTYVQAREFINDDMEFEDPFAIKDMDIAVERIRKAVDDFEKIAIYGDYDCDGVTSTVLLYSYLESQGADVMFYIPKRETEGYGMNKGAVERLSEQGVKLIITVDNGISAVEEIAYANNLGMEVVVTDHHQASDFLPDALAIVNPHRKDCKSGFKLLAGVGVAFKLVTALENSDYEYTFSQFADILSIGTVADIVPLIGENRSIVKLGIEAIKNTDNCGIVALLEMGKIKVENLSSQNIAFGIAPRINSAGRMADAALAVKLLLCDDMDNARAIAEEIEVLNRKRKEEEQQILFDIKAQISKAPEELNDRVLLFGGDGWHHGVIGISSSKVLEMFGKPNIMFSNEGDYMRGSARSLGEFSLYHALTDCSRLIARYGGHKLAAGLTIKKEKFPELKKAIEAYAKKHHKIMPIYTYEVDKVMKSQDLTIDNVKSLDILQPFGAENQEPIFLFEKAQIKQILPMSQNKHVKLKLDFQGMLIQAMLFGMSTDEFTYKEGEEIDFIGLVSINNYNNNEYLSIVIKDIHPTSFSQKGFFLARSYYEMFKRNEELSEKIMSKAIPSRDDIALIYKFLKTENGYSNDIDLLYNKFSKANINYFKYRLILDILQDANLINVSPILDGIAICEVSGKVSLQDTDTMKKLTKYTTI